MNFLIPRFLVDTADLINQAVTDAKLARDRCLLHLTGAVSIPNGAVTPISWDTEDADTAALHDLAVNPSRITVPSGYKLARVSCRIAYVSGASGIMQVFVNKNGVSSAGLPLDIRELSVGGSTRYISLASALIDVSPGDYFEVAVLQTTGAAMSLVVGASTWVAAEVWK